MREYGERHLVQEGNPPRDTKDNRNPNVSLNMAEAVAYCGINGIFPYVDLEGEFQLGEEAAQYDNLIALFDGIDIAATLHQRIQAIIDDPREIEVFDEDEDVPFDQARDSIQPLPPIMRREIFAEGTDLDSNSLGFYKRILDYSTEGRPIIRERIHADKNWAIYDPSALGIIANMGIKGVIVFQGNAARLYALYGITPAEVLNGIKEEILKLPLATSILFVNGSESVN